MGSQVQTDSSVLIISVSFRHGITTTIVREGATSSLMNGG